MNLGLLALAVSPGLAIAIYIYWRDKHEKEPIGLLVKCFLLGALTIIPAGIIEAIILGKFDLEFGDMGLLAALVSAFIFIGLTEEAVKFWVLIKYAYRKPDFNEPFDGIVYAVMISLGFATFENIMYVYQYGAEIGVLRMFTAVPMHAACGIIMGYHVGMAKFGGSSAKNGLLFAVLLHGTYDFFLLQGVSPFLYLFIVPVLIYAIILSRKALRAHSDASPFKK